MKNYVLQTSNLNKQFKDFIALNDINLSLESGKIYGLIGKNGAGKTTLMRIIAGLSFPTSGTISLFNSQNKKDYQEELARVGCLIEYPSMCGNMTANENLRLHRIMRGIPDSEIDEELLNIVGLKNVGKKQIKDFSLGMRQRLGIAIAMIGNPELILLDEPVNGLDPVGVIEIRNLIKDICQKRHVTILISSHNLPELFQTATDYVIIDKGQIKQTLTLEELEDRCKHHLVIECDEPQLAVEVIEQKLYSNNYKVLQDNTILLDDFIDDRKKVMKAFFDNNILPTKFAVEGDTLENYFLSVINDTAIERSVEND